MNGFLSPVKRLLYQFVLLLACYQISRCVFAFINKDQFDGFGFSALPAMLLSGFRFDLATVCYVNAVYVLLFLFTAGIKGLSFRNKGAQWIFICCNTLAFLFEISDWAYFPYNHKRATADILQLISRKGDFLNMLPGLMVDYWYVPLCGMLLVLLLIKLNQKMVKATPLDLSETIRTQSIRFLLVGIAMVIGMRGGLQMVPVGIRNAIGNTKSQFAPIVLNTPFSIIVTLTGNKIKEEQYYDDALLKQYINTTKYYGHKTFDRKNVVIIILESFSKEFTGIGGKKSYTPFLDSLMSESFVCTNAFANGNRSADGIPAILAGIPSLQEEPFTSSPYGANRITSVANLLAKKGYTTAFYHGGTNGTMSFDLFAANAGYQYYKGRNEYPDAKDYDGRWGIWDEPFLQFALKDFKQLKQPFCTSVFTLSSHQPFAIPQQYKDKFPKGTLPVHETIGYTDNALRLFFKEARMEDWYQNTLFVIVPDHCFALSDDDYYHYHQGRFAIPIVYFSPGDSQMKGSTEKLTQQLDIVPSVMDYLHYPDYFFAFGNSIFSNAAPRYTIQHWSGDVLWTMDNYFLRVVHQQPEGFYDVINDRLCKNNLLHKKDSLVQSSFDYLKAFRQVYSSSMIHNTLWLK